MCIDLLADVHKREFGVVPDRSAIQDISENGDLPEWLTRVLQAIIEGRDIECEYRSDGGQGASILLDASNLLGWQYTDDGESATLLLPKIGMTLHITREAILADGTGGCRAKLFARN